MFTGEESIPGGVAAVLFASLPLVIAAVAVATRTEAISANQIAGAVIASAGIAIIFWDRLNVSRKQGVGVAMILRTSVKT